MANTISVNVVADVKNIRQGIQQVNTQLTGFQSSIGKAKSVMTGLFAGAAVLGGGQAVIGMLKGSIGAASDLNETVSKTRTIFGPAAADIESFGSSAAKSLGISKQAALDGVSTFGNFFNQIGIGNAQSAKMSKSFVQMSSDLASFNNAAPVDVMEALSSATRGEYDSLQKYIPTINAAAVQNKALSMTHKQSVKDLTDAEKATALYTLAQQGQGKAAGDFARTSGGLANQQRILTAEWQNAKATIGNALLPIMTGFVTFLTTSALPAVRDFAGFFKENLWPALQDIGGVLTATVVPAFQALVGFFSDHTSTLIGFTVALAALFALQKIHAAFIAVEAVGGLVAYISQMGIVQAATKTWAAVQWVLNAAMSANPIALVVIAIAALIAIIILAWKNSETFRNIIIGAWNAIKTATSAVWGFIKDLVKGVFDAFMFYIKNFTLPGLIIGHWDDIKAATTTAWNAIKGAVSAVIDWIKGAATNAIETFKGIVTGAWNDIKTVTSTAWNGIKTAVSTGIDGVVTFVKGLPGRVLTGLGNIGSLLIDAGEDMMKGFLRGIGNMAGRIKDAALAPVKDAVGAVKGFLGINSPSRLFTQIGQYVNAGLVKGLKDTAGVTTAATGMARAVANGFSAPELTLAPSFAGNGAGLAGGTVVNVTVVAPVGSNPQDIGRELDQYLSAYERFGGRRLSGT